MWKRPKTEQERITWWRRRRHPLCPSCRHDLLATVHDGLDRCPECGCEFAPDELRIGWAPGDWTESVGLRRAVVTLCCRSGIALLIWMGALAAFHWMESLNHSAVLRIGIEAALLLLALFVQLLIGRILSQRLTESVGGTGKLLLIMAILADAMVVAIGFFTMNVWYPAGNGGWISLAFSPMGTGLIVYTLLHDD